MYVQDAEAREKARQFWHHLAVAVALYVGIAIAYMAKKGVQEWWALRSRAQLTYLLHHAYLKSKVRCGSGSNVCASSYSRTLGTDPRWCNRFFGRLSIN